MRRPCEHGSRAPPEPLYASGDSPTNDGSWLGDCESVRGDSVWLSVPEGVGVGLGEPDGVLTWVDVSDGDKELGEYEALEVKVEGMGALDDPKRVDACDGLRE